MPASFAGDGQFVTESDIARARVPVGFSLQRLLQQLAEFPFPAQTQRKIAKHKTQYIALHLVRIVIGTLVQRRVHPCARLPGKGPERHIAQVGQQGGDIDFFGRSVPSLSGKGTRLHGCMKRTRHLLDDALLLLALEHRLDHRDRQADAAHLLEPQHHDGTADRADGLAYRIENRAVGDAQQLRGHGGILQNHTCQFGRAAFAAPGNVGDVPRGVRKHRHTGVAKFLHPRAQPSRVRPAALCRLLFPDFR